MLKKKVYKQMACNYFPSNKISSKSLSTGTIESDINNLNLKLIISFQYT